MAGFQDQLIGPAPYVETLPVDAYTRVGMIKQEQYDRGVEKVQGYIDSVAGIEALMPEQKDYVNKTVNQLQSQVQQIAGSDFSNSQVVNSVGHLTKQMAADPIIQNTVYATNAYRSESAKMKAAQESGKSSPSNEYVFHRGVQNWLGSHDPSKSFDAEYNPYVDYKGKMVKALNERLGKPDEYLTEMPYKRGADGKVINDEHGQPIIDYAMMQETYKGVSAEAIKNVVDSTLDENDKRQIAIDGQYEYRGYGKPDLKQSADRSYQSRLDQINSTIQGLQVEKAKNSTDVAYQSQIDAQIGKLSDQATGLKSSYLSDIDSIDKDPEGYKGSLYGQNWLSKFSEGYSYSQHSLKFVENPFFMAAEKERENNIKFAEFQETRQFHYDQLKQQAVIEAAKLDLDREKLKYMKKKNGDGEGDDNFLGTSVSFPEEIEHRPDKTEADITNSIAETSKQLDFDGIKLLASTTTGLVEKTTGDDDGNGQAFEWAGTTKEEKEKNKTTGMAIINSYKDGTFTGTPTPQITAFFNKNAIAMKDVADQKKAIRDAQALVDKNAATNIGNITSTIKPLYVESPSGGKYLITPEQMLSFNRRLASITAAGPVPVYDDKAAESMFQTPVEKLLYSVISKKPSERNANDKFIINKLANLHYNVNAPYSDILEKRDNAITNTLKSGFTIEQPVSTELLQFKGADKAQALVFGKQVFGSTANVKKPTGRNYDAGKISEMLNEKNAAGTSFYLINRGDGKLSLRYQNETVSAGKPREIDLTQQQVDNVFGSNIGANTFLSMTKSINLSKLDPKHGLPTTNVQREGAKSALPLNNGQFKNFNVRFDVEQAGDDSQADKYQLRIYAYDKRTKESKEGVVNFGNGTLLNQAQIAAALATINDNTVDQVVNPPAK